MATQTVTAPAVMKIVNTSTSAKVFAPYKENFTTKMAAGAVVELQVKTSGQALYYLAQATDDLTVERLADFDQTAGAIKINAKEKITLTNSSSKAINFIPYRENFEYSVAAGDAVELTSENCGQVLYYLSQATDGLTIAHEAVQE